LRNTQFKSLNDAKKIFKEICEKEAVLPVVRCQGWATILAAAFMSSGAVTTPRFGRFF
jgi:hypothetical protein